MSLRVAAALAIATLGLAASEASGETFLAWTTDDGVLAYADDPKRVPAKYRDAARERTWEDLRRETDKRWTVDNSRKDPR